MAGKVRDGAGAVLRAADEVTGGGGGAGASIAIKSDRPPNPIPSATTAQMTSVFIDIPRHATGRE